MTQKVGPTHQWWTEGKDRDNDNGKYVHKEKESHKILKQVKTPRIKEFACLEVKFWKTCELRVISGEAYEDRVKL
jgi:hypothetical protein